MFSVFICYLCTGNHPQSEYIMLKKILILTLLPLWLTAALAQGGDNHGAARRNITRAMQLLDSTMSKCFTGSDMLMGDIYDLESRTSQGVADVWPYTAAIEAVNTVMEALESGKDRFPELYKSNFERYRSLLYQLYSGLDFYSGTFTLTSYTQTRQWSVYGVHRGRAKGGAEVAGIENVYDDQMWIMREFVRAYRITGDEQFLSRAEYLASYIIDGWDCTLNTAGHENGGITWGPGYNSKHACSNAPAISPLVWFAEIYKAKRAKTTLRYIAPDGKRKARRMSKHEFYLTFAKKIYSWQKNSLINNKTGVYWDMLGADNTIQYEEINGTRYRRHTRTGHPSGTAFTYNSGTMLCGAADLLRATGDTAYLSDLKALAKNSYLFFRGEPQTISGRQCYQFPYDRNTLSGFNAWFGNVLLRAYTECDENEDAALACQCFQENLDYAWDNYLRHGFLPNNLLGGWDGNRKTKPFHQLAFTAEYAALAKRLMRP